jgi:hypothetical protein
VIYISDCSKSRAFGPHYKIIPDVGARPLPVATVQKELERTSTGIAIIKKSDTAGAVHGGMAHPNSSTVEMLAFPKYIGL